MNRSSAFVSVRESSESCEDVAGEESVWELGALGALVLLGVDCLMVGKAVSHFWASTLSVVLLMGGGFLTVHCEPKTFLGRRSLYPALYLTSFDYVREKLA